MRRDVQDKHAMSSHDHEEALALGKNFHVYNQVLEFL